MSIAERGTMRALPGVLLRIIRRQEVAFAAVGVANTLLGMVMTVFFETVLGRSWPPAIAVALAYAVCIVFAFVAHRRLVFRVRGQVMRDFARFVLVNSGGLVLNMAGVQVAVDVLRLPERPATVVAMGLVAVASYFGHRHFSFRRSPTRAESGDVVHGGAEAGPDEVPSGTVGTDR
ncbi:GtrA family protein [Nocardia alni]|uniref:GtrA family protein n=1 Tax=Nocardia alni TaxID=2815723 RepID=UPI0027E1ED7E|nr:GtrA family protein [Nocardia alni]